MHVHQGHYCCRSIHCQSQCDITLPLAAQQPAHASGMLYVQLISFYFTYLLEEVHPDLASRVCLMTPGTTFLLLNSGVCADLTACAPYMLCSSCV